MIHSPRFAGIVYLAMGFLFIYLAIFNVSTVGWNVWTFLFIAIAAVDIFVAIRFLTIKANNKKE